MGLVALVVVKGSKALQLPVCGSSAGAPEGERELGQSNSPKLASGLLHIIECPVYISQV